MDRVIISHSSEETRQIGCQLGRSLPENSVLFFGDLGAGKTTLIQGLIAGAVGCPHEDVVSPTFVYLNIYDGSREKRVYHFDLYRLKNAEEFLGMGFDDYFQAGGVCCVEWAERIEELLPPNCLRIKMTHRSEQERLIEIRQDV